MGDLKFILGFVAGWIATTKEGREAASKLADKTAEFIKQQMETEKEKAN